MRIIFPAVCSTTMTLPSSSIATPRGSCNPVARTSSVSSGRKTSTLPVPCSATTIVPGSNWSRARVGDNINCPSRMAMVAKITNSEMMMVLICRLLTSNVLAFINSSSLQVGHEPHALRQSSSKQKGLRGWALPDRGRLVQWDSDASQGCSVPGRPDFRSLN